MATGIVGRPERDGTGCRLAGRSAGKVFREVASGAQTSRAQLRKALDQLDAGDVLM